MRRSIFGWLGFCMMLASSAAGAAQISASVDRNTVHLGDTLTLNITVKDANPSAGPDLDPLRKDFDVQQTSNSSNFSFINGKSSRTTVWGVALRPLHVGSVIIPALDVAGGHTQALNVTVLPAATGAQGGPGDDAFVETSVQPLSVYVGQQALYRVRLFYVAGLMAQGNLQEPNISGADVQQLGKADQYQTRRGGRSYTVVERDYALIAHKPGTITLPPINFQGQLGRGGGFPGFATNMRQINVRSPSLTMQVKAKPTVASEPWLPAQSVTLTASGLPADGKIKAGDPMTLTLTEQAVGLPFEDLPALTLPDIVGAEVYPDKPDTGTSNDGQWLHGKRQRSFAIVPTRAGNLTIPAMTLHWWNVTTDKAEVITLPERTFSVSGSAGSIAASPPSGPAAPVAGAGLPAAPSPVAASPAIAAPRPWRRAAAALLALWLATLLAWWWHARLSSRPKAPMPVPDAVQRPGMRDARKAFRAALSAGDGAAIARTLLAWAQSERPELHGLEAVGAALADAQQRQSIIALERSRFGTASAEPDSAAIGRAFAKGFAWLAPERHQPRGEGLPPLYPFGDRGKPAD